MILGRQCLQKKTHILIVLLLFCRISMHSKINNRILYIKTYKNIYYRKVTNIKELKTIQERLAAYFLRNEIHFCFLKSRLRSILPRNIPVRVWTFFGPSGCKVILDRFSDIWARTDKTQIFIYMYWIFPTATAAASTYTIEFIAIYSSEIVYNKILSLKF